MAPHASADTFAVGAVWEIADLSRWIEITLGAIR
jgi:hypothetical protein